MAGDPLATSFSKTPSFKDVIRNSQMLKEEGNAFYKAKNYKKAIGKYHRAIFWLKSVDNNAYAGLGEMLGVQAPTKEPPAPGCGDQDAVIMLKADCYNNLAACLLLQENPTYEKVVLYCDKVLELLPANLKASYRKSVALCQLKNFENALETLKQAEDTPLGRIDQNIKTQIALCQRELLKQDEKLKDAYKGMFDNNKSYPPDTKAASS